MKAASRAVKAQYKGKRYSISNDFLLKANGAFECYNVTENMLHLVRLGQRGRRLAISAKNLLNIRADSFDEGISAGMVVEI